MRPVSKSSTVKSPDVALSGLFQNWISIAEEGHVNDIIDTSLELRASVRMGKA